MRILIVIVLYKQVTKKSIAYNSLEEAKNGVLFEYGFYIHDNSPFRDIDVDKNIYYSFYPENPGLSFAFNRAAEYAVKFNYSWLLLSDQDTYYPPEILKEYEQVIENNLDVKLIVPKVKTKKGKLLSPCKYTHKRGKGLHKISSGKHILRDLSVINSGIMVNIDTFIKCGGYNEKVPVDLSDHQFIERYRKVDDIFWVLNNETLQDFSNENIVPDNMYDRFNNFINSVKNCERRNVRDNIDYFCLLLRRAVALTIRTKQIRFFKAFIQSLKSKKSIG